MVRVSSLAFGIFVLAAISIPLSGAQSPQNETAPELKIGFPKVLFKDLHPNLVQIAAQPFKDTIQKTAGVKASLVIADDYQVLADQLKAKQIDIAVFHGFEYAWIEKSDPDLVPLVITVPNCGKVQACLIVNTGTSVKAPADLKGESVSVPKGSKAHCQMFLDRVREGLPNDRCCPLNAVGQTPEDVLDGVASQKCDSALVDVSALLAYQADKPGLGSCLKVLKQSIPLPPAVVVCRKGALTSAQSQAFQDGLLNCAKTGQGRLFLTFWNLKGFALVTQDYYDLLAKCRETYPAPAPKK